MKFDAEKGQFAPHEIPAKIKKTIYTHYVMSGYEWDIGKLKNYDSDLSGEHMIVVAETQVTINIPKTNLKEKVIEALKAEKKKQEAEHFEKMYKLQEKIDSLLCLEYKP